VAEGHNAEQQALKQERWELLEHINAMTEKPMIALAFVWLWLLIMDLTTGLGPILQLVNYVVWILFILDFGIEITIAPDRGQYLRRNWLTTLSLALPALSVLSIFKAARALRLIRAARTVRTVSLFRLVTSLNRGMRATAGTLGRRGIGYVVALTVIVLFAGAAGMFAFERPDAAQATNMEARSDQGGFENYGKAVWWTAMLLTTAGSDEWPDTAEGRILCFFLALYAFAVFGYITATIASYFIDTAKHSSPSSDKSSIPEWVAIRDDLISIRDELAGLTADLNAQLNQEVRVDDSDSTNVGPSRAS